MFKLFLSVFVLHSLAFAKSPNLPPIGASAFDYLIARTGGVVPYPISKLIAEMEKAGIGTSVQVYIPDGRSLQRFNTNFESPRLLISGTSTGDGGVGEISRRQPRPIRRAEELLTALPLDKLFVGYSRDTNSLEIISFNEQANRYEFQIVENYGRGMQALTKYAPRALCISCHQNEAPIFSIAPWSETQTNEKVLKQLRAEYAVNLVADQALDFDSQIRHAHDFQYIKEIWDRGCSGPIERVAECRKAFIQLAFLQTWLLTTGRSLEMEQRAKEYENIMKKSWFKEIRLSTSELFDRSIEQFPKDEPLPKYLNPQTIRPTFQIKTPSTKPIGVGIFGEYSGSEGISAVQEIAMSLVSAREMNFVIKYVKGDESILEDALNSNGMKALLRKPFPGRTKLLKVLWRNMGIPVSEKTWLDGVVNLPEKVDAQASSGDEIKINPRYPALHLFRKNCMGCHTNQADHRLNFMSEANDAKQWKILVSNPLVKERLNYEKSKRSQRMPPEFSDEGKFLRTEGNLERLEMFLQLKNDCEKYLK